MIWKLFRKARASAKVRSGEGRRRSFKPLLEGLEERALLATTQALFTLDAPTFTSATVNTNYITLAGSGTGGGVSFTLPAQSTSGSGSTATSSLRSATSGQFLVTFDPANPTASGLSIASTGTLLDTSPYRNNLGAIVPLLPAVGGGTAGDFGTAAPADFGGTINALGLLPVGRVAIRDFLATVSTAAPVPVTGSGLAFNFSSQSETLRTTGGAIDFNINTTLTSPPTQIAGSASAANLSALNASTAGGTLTNLNNALGQWQIRLPLSLTLVQNIDATTVVNLTVTGTIVGTWTPLATVSSIVVNDGAVQRSLVTSLTVTFDRTVTLPADPTLAFAVTGPSGSVGLNVASTVDAQGRTVARLTFTGAGVVNGSVANGSYTLTVRGDQILDSLGRPVDGNGDGQPGGNTTFGFTRKYADVNGDGLVTIQVIISPTSLPSVAYGDDFGALLAALNSRQGDANYVAYLDADGDGDIDSFDLNYFSSDVVTSVLLP